MTVSQSGSLAHKNFFPTYSTLNNDQPQSKAAQPSTHPLNLPQTISTSPHQYRYTPINQPVPSNYQYYQPGSFNYQGTSSTGYQAPVTSVNRYAGVMGQLQSGASSVVDSMPGFVQAGSLQGQELDFTKGANLQYQQRQGVNRFYQDGKAESHNLEENNVSSKTHQMYQVVD